MCHFKDADHRRTTPSLHPERWPQGHGERLLCRRISGFWEVATTGKKAYVLGQMITSSNEETIYCGRGSIGILWPILREHLFVSIPVGWPATAHLQSYQSQVLLFIESLTQELPEGSPAEWLSSCCWSPPRGRSALPTQLSIPLGTAWQSEGPAPQLFPSPSSSFCPMGSPRGHLAHRPQDRCRRWPHPPHGCR